MSSKPVLDQVALVCNCFGDGESFQDVLVDWLEFIGGRPGQVIIVDNGSPQASRESVYSAFQNGLIDPHLPFVDESVSSVVSHLADFETEMRKFNRYRRLISGQSAVFRREVDTIFGCG